MAPSHTRISPLAQERLPELKAALQADFGLQASNGDIASALIHGATVAQAAGMLLGYNMYTAREENRDDSETD
jgi:hypothetical protein